MLLQACQRIERLWPVDSLILGGAGLAGMAARLQGRLGLRLIDSVAAAAHQGPAFVLREPAAAATGPALCRRGRRTGSARGG